LRFGVGAPKALQRATFQKNSCSDPGTVVDTESLDVKNETFFSILGVGRVHKIDFLRLCIDIRLFSQLSGWKGKRNILRPGGASRLWRDRIGGNNPDSEAVFWLPRGTCPRPPYAKPKRRSDGESQIIFRPEPMKGPAPHYVPPWAGCAPWAPPETLRLGDEFSRKSA